MLNHDLHCSPFGTSRVQGRAAPDLFIGPALDGSILLEVMVERTAVGLVVFHVMPARPKIIEAAEKGTQ